MPWTLNTTTANPRDAPLQYRGRAFPKGGPPAEKALHGKGVIVLDSYFPLGNPWGAEGLEEVPSLLAVSAVSALPS